MPTLTFRSPMPGPAHELFAWHARPGAFERLAPPWADVTLERFEGIRDGQRAVIRVGAGPLRIRWIAEHHDYVEGRQFCDRQVKGPFKDWDHQHRMEPDGPNRSRLVDHITYTPPLGGLGAWMAGPRLRDQLERQFAYRHRITARDLALHQRYNPDRERLKIAVSGTSGLIGSSLTAFLSAGGHDVRRLVRSHPTQENEIYWNHRTGAVESAKLEGLDAVIHLAGESVYALRWTQEKKTRILRSRVAGTRLISETLAKLQRPPRVFVAASGVGYYGHRGAEVLKEASPPGEKGFLTAVTREWEAATQPAFDAGLRTVQLRIGAVLSPQGGVLALLVPAFRLGLGGRIRRVDPYVSWIALDDVLGAIYHVLWDATDGPVNLTAPAPVPMSTFADTLGAVLHRPTWLHVPPTLARLATGAIADEVLLTSTRVIPERLQQSGYDFYLKDLRTALIHQLGLHGDENTSPRAA